MKKTQLTSKHKHKRSFSSKLDDSQPQKDQQKIAMIKNSHAFDVQYFVQKSDETANSLSIIVDQLNDQNNPPETKTQSTRSFNNIQANKAKKFVKQFFEYAPLRDSNYFTQWDEEYNFSCLLKLKDRFQKNYKQQTQKGNYFRQRQKNKLIEINAQYQIQNRLNFALEDKEDFNGQVSKYLRRLGRLERRQI